MTRSIQLPSFIVLAVLCAQGAVAQARPQATALSMSDTLPGRVVQRALDAYATRHDLDAVFAEYDTTFLHEYLGDPTGPQRVRRAEWLQMMKRNRAVGQFMKTWRLVNVRRDTFGPFVNDVWTFRSPEGKERKQFELLEVRNGNIVREIESP